MVMPSLPRLRCQMALRKLEEAACGSRYSNSNGSPFAFRSTPSPSTFQPAASKSARAFFRLSRSAFGLVSVRGGTYGMPNTSGGSLARESMRTSQPSRPSLGGLPGWQSESSRWV